MNMSTSEVQRLRMALCIRQTGFPTLSPEGRNKFSFQNAVVLSEHYIMEKVQKLSDPICFLTVNKNVW
jgi:hypothetical protein